MKAELLLVDLGNTRVKWAAPGADGRLRIAGRRPTGEISSRWIRALAAKYPERQLILASVVPKWTPIFEKAFNGRAVVVSGRLAALRTCFAYPKPGEVGADRIAAALAIRAEGRFPAIIAACGTAVAFTVLDAKGRICGGAIAPGLHARAAALSSSTAQLPAAVLRAPVSALGTSTRDAIRSGLILGYAGEVRELITRLSAAVGSRPRLVLTGGDAPLVAKLLDRPHSLRPLLVLEGLRIMAGRLSAAAEE